MQAVSGMCKKIHFLWKIGFFRKKSTLPRFARREGRWLTALNNTNNVALLDSEEDDDQRKEREGLNERQTEHEEKEDSRPGAGIACEGFDGRRGCLALTQAAKSGSQCEADADADGIQVNWSPAALCKSRNGAAQN
jgi:hypothetical protein